MLEPLLHLGFALTGVGTVLLGAILPRLSAQWHLRDKDAGLLLLVQFATSASGALLVRRNLWKALACGYGLIGAGAICIFLLQQKSLPAFGVYGLGLGLAMTSTNMLTGRRYPHRMGAALALAEFFMERWCCGLSSSGRSISAPCHRRCRVWPDRADGIYRSPCYRCLRTEVIWMPRQDPDRLPPESERQQPSFTLRCSPFSMLGSRHPSGTG